MSVVTLTEARQSAPREATGTSQLPARELTVPELVTALAAALDACPTGGWVGLQSTQLRGLLTGLNRVVARIGAHQVAAARELDRAGAARAAGASSTGALIAQDFGGDRRAGHELIRAASALDQGKADATEAALAAGAITTTQAGIIGQALSHLPDSLTPGQRGSCEEAMIRDAQRLSLPDLRRRGDRLVDAAGTAPTALFPDADTPDHNGAGGGPQAAGGIEAPDGADDDPDLDPDAFEARVVEAREQRAWARTELVMRDNTDGTWTGRFTLPDLQAELLKTLLDAHAAPRRSHLRTAGRPGAGGEQGTDGAGQRHLTEPAAADLNYPQRLGQAFAALIEHTPTTGFAQTGGTPAVLAVTLNYSTLLDQLAAAGVSTAAGTTGNASSGCATLSTGTRISPAQARRLACEHRLLPQVFDGASLPLDMGRAQRLFTSSQRLAIAQRDRGCTFAGCDRPPGWCETHHANKQWAKGGTTNLEDGALLCSYHHQYVHRHRWQSRVNPRDGTPEYRPPTVPGRPPAAWQRNTRYRP